MQKNTFLFQEAEQALRAAVDGAIDHAAETAGSELRSLGSRIRPHEYFVDAVMRNLFLPFCGAVPKTSRGSGSEAGWGILYMGRDVTRHRGGTRMCKQLTADEVNNGRKCP
jgi:hypothetical protein